MNKQNEHNHPSAHGHSQHHGGQRPHRRAPHKDWRLWGIVGVMLLAMLVYLLTSDESITPTGNTASPPVPAAAGP